MGCSDSKEEDVQLSSKLPSVVQQGKAAAATESAAPSPRPAPPEPVKRDSFRPSLTTADPSHRSLLKRRSAATAAERMIALTAGTNFYDFYCKPVLVSYGASCKVMTAYNKVTNAKVACKMIPKSVRNPGPQRVAVLNEVGILKEVEDHPNAIKLLEVYDTNNNYYIVMDCCDGGELFEHITKSREVFTERQAAQILRSLMAFLAHMHSKGMAHMDIKPENIMFDSEGADGVVKVIDFGSSVYLQHDETVRDAFGTVRYSSPEMAADNGIGQKTDIWSAGVVMYFMLCGSAPFLKRDEIDTLNYIKNKPKVKFSGDRWASISQHAKDCISRMLEVEPDARPTAQEVLQMTWLHIQVPDTSIQTDILAHLRAFANQSRMRRLLLGLMAAKLSGSEANRLLNQFYSMDSDFSGTIELAELAKVTKQALPDLDPSEVEKLFYALDLNRTGTVDVKEFFASLLQTMAPENQVEVAYKSFAHLDRDRSGFVTKDAFVDGMVQQALLSGMDGTDTSALVTELEAEFQALDANSDGVLSFDEFKSVLGLDEQLAAKRGKLRVVQEYNLSGRLGGLANIAEVGTASTTAASSQRGEKPTMSEGEKGASIVRLALAFHENNQRQVSLNGGEQGAGAGAGAGTSQNGDMDRHSAGGRCSYVGSAGDGGGERAEPSSHSGKPGSRAHSYSSSSHNAMAGKAAALTAAVAAQTAASSMSNARLALDDHLWLEDPALHAAKRRGRGGGGAAGGGSPVVASATAVVGRGSDAAEARRSGAGVAAGGSIPGHIPPKGYGGH